MKKLVLVLTITFLLAPVDSVTAEDEIETSILIDNNRYICKIAFDPNAKLLLIVMIK